MITDNQMAEIKVGDKLETPDGVAEVTAVLDTDNIKFKRYDGKIAVFDKSECSVGTTTPTKK